MNSLDELEEYYKNYELKYLNDFVNDKELLGIGLCKLKKDLYKMKSFAYRRMIINNFKVMREKIFADVFCIRDYSDVYDKDDKILNELISLSDENIGMYENIEKLVNDDNYRDILKLLDFQVDCFINNYNYLISKRDSLEKSVNGYRFSDYRYDDNRILYKVFIKNKIKLFDNKSIVKTKKI